MKHIITLKLFASIGRLTPENADAFPITPGTKVADLVRDLEIPPVEAKLIFINGRRVEQDAVLNDGDRVGIFPPVGGG